MRGLFALWLAAMMFIPLSTAQAAEKGIIIRAGDLLAQPFIDAAKSGPVTANQPVTILERRGGWTQVESNGGTGWVRTLNIRLEAGQRPTGATGQAAAFRTGSSGRTVTTGVKGLDEDDIRNASPDAAQVAQLSSLAVSPAEARDNAARNNLREQNVAYLGKSKGKGK